MQSNHHVGRLVRQINFTEKGENKTKIAYFKLAINDLKDGKATYIEYIAFNKTAEYLRDFGNEVGQVIEVEFVMRNHDYTDRQSGKKVYTVQNQVTQLRLYHTKQKIDEIKNDNVDLKSSGLEATSSIPNFGSDDFDIIGG
ncbi:single-stranded DNA-binding protein [Leuconostoc pseudomesenteroides]|uniref:single-stranded DNA-binding protein n=1 Tax=Leuconostoc pseudomesenteroides TaxID=33968 RepID=UPI00289CC161|nr:single-stranded DNA-binding protein [Leuconostoc pseudomesenteroides]